MVNLYTNQEIIVDNQCFSISQPARHTKLEKADILEMTVKYLQNMQRNQINIDSIPTDAVVLHKFKAGFSDCTNEVNRYINQIDGVDMSVKQRLLGHLNECVTGIHQVSTPYKSMRPQSPNNITPILPHPNGYGNGESGGGTGGDDIFNSSVSIHYANNHIYLHMYILEGF